MELSDAEWRIALLGFAVLAGCLLWWWLARWFARPASPDPWGPDVAEALDSPEATPICPHCQTPHELNRWFCPRCGRAVGDCTNLLAPFYAFSIGDVLRDGIDNGKCLGRPRRLSTVAIGACAYLLFAPLLLQYALFWLWVVIGDFVAVIV